jgi:hypothetical protein
MKTEKLTKEGIQNANTPNSGTKAAIDNPNSKLPLKKKKKHNSALVAASQARSATSGVDANAYRDGGFSDTGTNLSYREDV